MTNVDKVQALSIKWDIMDVSLGAIHNPEWL